MLETVKIHFAYVENNMGDMLNIMIPEKIFGVNVKHTNNPYQAQMSGIGSFLSSYFKKQNSLEKEKLGKKVTRSFLDNICDRTLIWSTGFIDYDDNNLEVSVRNPKKLELLSVRGELSKKRIEKILGKKLDIPTGDGGLLANMLIDEKIEKKYSIGIIPHYREYSENIFSEYNLKKIYGERAKLINLQEDRFKVIKDLSECEVILSSSLHGLIVSDSLGIPNMRMIYSDKLLGDGFKFDDYFSSFNVKPKTAEIKKNEEFPSLNTIYDNYLIDPSKVENKQKEIYSILNKIFNGK